MRLLRSLVILLAACCLEQMVTASPTLLLSPQRSKRLARDRERQTSRWVAFENRVNTVPDSPERGFELALYVAVTGDERRGREALEWAAAHPCERRQTALIRDWVASQMKSSPAGSPAVSPCAGAEQGSIRAYRDQLFTTGSLSPQDKQSVLSALQNGAYRKSDELYAAVEFFLAAKSLAQIDLREEAPRFFSELPVLLLLSLSPDKVERPDWQTHIAALALVSLEPNSDRSQFLQGWAIEDRNTVHDGPGVAYELLWADPYLPGIGYQNLDPWIYDDDTGTLLARSDWSADACSIQIDTHGKHATKCAPDWERRAMAFGHLQLKPMMEKCIEPSRTPNDAVILSGLAPGQKIRYDAGDGKNQIVNASPTGLWRIPVNATGKVCLAR